MLLQTVNSSNTDILLDGANLVFEGYLANAYETTLTAAGATADRTITLPNVTGTVITTGNLTVDGSTTGDVLVGEGDSCIWYRIWKLETMASAFKNAGMTVVTTDTSVANLYTALK